MDNMEVDPQIPQSQPLTGTMIENSAGGYTWQVNDMDRLRRFLCLGSEGGTYYIGEQKLGIENAQCINKLVKEGKGEQVVKEIKTFSTEGRAAKQNPTLFALALCARQDNDPKTKKASYDALADICRIPTHLFSFVEYSEALSRGTGWGRAHRRAISKWYNRFSKDPKHLALHVTKYRNRNGWTHKDILRLCHLKPESDGVGAVVRYVIKGLDVSKTDFLREGVDPHIEATLTFLDAVEKAKVSKNEDEVIELIKAHNLVREHIPTQMLNSANIWRQLLQKMPMTALIRNLGKMTAIQVLTSSESCEETKMAVRKLKDERALKAAKVHPFNILVALKTYQQGRGDKGKLKWSPVQEIVQALDDAFYMAFKFVEPTNQRYCLAVDVSGSMSWGKVVGSDVMTPRDAAAALTMVTARTEPNHEIVGFSTDLVPIPINPTMDLATVGNVMDSIPMGGTDCAQPMLWAKKHDKKFDVFIVFTDNETWFGRVHPAEAVHEYRRTSGIWNAKLIVCGLASNKFTIADPEDPGMLDMAGFDSAGPEVIRNFSLGLL